MENLRLVVFDFETTGLSPASGERVIEIGAVALVGGEPRAEFHSLVATERKIHGPPARCMESAPPSLPEPRIRMKSFPVSTDLI